MKTIDARNLECPKPVILTKKTLDSGESEFKVLVDNDVAKKNVLKLLNNFNCNYEIEELNDDFEITIKMEATKKEVVQHNSLVILCKTNLFGEGDEKLGLILMKSFFYSLTELNNTPSYIILMNSGVKLALENSLILNTLQDLENKGAKILSCGTCLDFYNLKDILAIGEITNMYTATEILAQADNVISI